MTSRKLKPGALPTPDQVRKAREAAGLTQTEAAALIYSSLRTWANHEGSSPTYCRPMRASDFELFLLKTGQMDLALVAEQYDRQLAAKEEALAAIEKARAEKAKA